MSPLGLLHRGPVAVGFQTEVEQPFGFFLLGRYEPHHVFVESAFYDFGMYVGGEAILVLLVCHLAYILIRFFCHYNFCFTSISANVSRMSPSRMSS